MGRRRRSSPGPPASPVSGDWLAGAPRWRRRPGSPRSGSTAPARSAAPLARRLRQRRPKSPASRSRAPGSPAPRSARASVLAARQYPIDLVFYDNQRDDARRVANAEAAIARKVDLYVQYHRGAPANATVAQKLKAAGIPVLAVNYPVPGAPLYSHRQRGGRPHGRRGAGRVRRRTWPGQPIVAVVIGRVSATRRSRAGARAGRRRDAAPAPARRAAHDARHPGQSRAGRPRCSAAFLAAQPVAQDPGRRHRRRHRAGGEVRGGGRGPPARHGDRQPRRRSHASTAARTIARRSTRTIAAASSSARSRSTWIAGLRGAAARAADAAR